jgi:hypothetical protein
MTLAKSLIMGSKNEVPGHPHRIHRSKKNRKKRSGSGHIQIFGSLKHHRKAKLEALKIKELESGY